MKKNAAVLLIASITVLLALTLCACSDSYYLSFEESKYTINVNGSFSPVVNARGKVSDDYTLISENSTIAKVEGHEVIGLKKGVTVLVASQGKKQAKTTLYVTDGSSSTETPVISVDRFYVNFYIVNYELLGLSNGLVKSVIYPVGTEVTFDVPVYAGYDVFGWYETANCDTQAFKSFVVTDNIDLYCRVEQKENPFVYNKSGLVTGLLYDELPHEELVFPEEANGVKLVGIDSEAFKGDATLKKVVIPSSYETIGDFAFAGCVNLEEVVFNKNSALVSIGRHAFSVTAEQADDEVVVGDDACKKLKSRNLPDSVSEIGDFAFAYCSSLALDSVPNSLKVINYGVFYSTKITALDLSGVTEIKSYAFAKCENLALVTNTKSVKLCEVNAFSGSLFFMREQENGGAVIADTILLSCYAKLGTLLPGRVDLSDKTLTLIADNAFSGENQAELTVILPDNDILIGKDAFNKNEKHVYIAVPRARLSSYRSKYESYSDYFCERIIIDVTDETTETDENGNSVSVVKDNFGRHSLLLLKDGTYCYDKYERLRAKNGNTYSASVIDFATLPVAGDIKRINPGAINLKTKEAPGGGRLTTLKLRGVNEIGTWGIFNCPKLTTIDLTACREVVKIGSNSIGFSSLSPDLKIVVLSGNLNAYKTAWKNYTRLTEKLCAN